MILRLTDSPTGSTRLSQAPTAFALSGVCWLVDSGWPRAASATATLVAAGPGWNLSCSTDLRCHLTCHPSPSSGQPSKQKAPVLGEQGPA
jgi:hypothetical protein